MSKLGRSSRKSALSHLNVSFVIPDFECQLLKFQATGFYSNRRTSNTAFSPPKAKELETAMRTGISRA